jgi:hypothetical protein
MSESNEFTMGRFAERYAVRTGKLSNSRHQTLHASKGGGPSPVEAKAASPPSVQPMKQYVTFMSKAATLSAKSTN